MGIGAHLVAMDVSGVGEPVTLGASPPLPGLIADVVVRDGIAYVAVSQERVLLDDPGGLFELDLEAAAPPMPTRPFFPCSRLKFLESRSRLAAAADTLSGRPPSVSLIDPFAPDVFETIEFFDDFGPGSDALDVIENMAEIELSVRSRDCLSRRHPTIDALAAAITLGRSVATATTPPSNGALPTTTPAPSSTASILTTRSGTVLSATSQMQRRPNPAGSVWLHLGLLGIYVVIRSL